MLAFAGDRHREERAPGGAAIPGLPASYGDATLAVRADVLALEGRP